MGTEKWVAFQERVERNKQRSLVFKMAQTEAVQERMKEDAKRLVETGLPVLVKAGQEFKPPQTAKTTITIDLPWET